MLEGKTELSENFQRLLFTCLLCETCTANCPSGLKTDRLMKAMRSEIQERLGPDWQKRVFENLLGDKRRLPFFLFCERTRENLFSSQEGKSVRPADFELPRAGSKALRQQVPEVNSTPAAKGKVLYFTGCATNYFYPDVGKSVIKVLHRLGMEVIIPRGQMCCGVPLFQAGERKKALKNIRENLKLFNRKDVEEVVVDTWIVKLAAAPAFALDTETTSLNAMQAELVGVSFPIGQGEAAYLPLAHHYAGAPEQLDRDAALAKLKPLLENPEPKIVGQHLKYDRHIFANYGIRLAGVVDDTLLQSYVLEAHQPHELGNLASRHLGLATISYDDVTGKGASRIGFEQVAVKRASEYAAEDAGHATGA